ncbi:MAG: hypothetical protein H7Y12_14200 [Sphingobacteriaceae bacterium]|nr:hypothetical protein [Cytophagaceae bacterium]
MEDTALEHVPGWSEDQVARLQEVWITTAEQVVALSATTHGLRSLAEQLDVTQEQARELVDSARAVLTPSLREALETKPDTDDRGLGVLPPAKGKND